MNVYIAGPMGGVPEWNYPAFFEREEQLHALGHTVINPARNFSGRTDLPWHVFIGRAMLQVAKEADAIDFLPDWHNSRGARIEYLIARSRNLPFITRVKSKELDAIVAKARDLVFGARNEDYGHPDEDFKRQSEIARAMHIPIYPASVPLFMMAVKLSRQVNQDKEDNLVDLCGYVMTIYFDELRDNKAKDKE